MYARRNAITIGLLWIVLMLIGIFWYIRETKQLEEVKIKNEELTHQLDGSLEVVKALNSVEDKYRLLKQNWVGAAKKILATDEPSFSLYYLNWLVNNYNIILDFDFVLNNITDNGDVTTFIFTLTGEGSYHDLYRLIWLLTENPLLYQIESFSLSQDPGDIDILNFKMQIRGFSLKRELDSGQQFNFASMRSDVEIGLFHDAFRPLRPKQEVRRIASMFRKEVPKPVLKPKDDGLVDIRHSTLQAVANSKVYLKDKNGKLITLKKGDKVRMGRLLRINQKKSEVEFILNKGGVTQKVTLGLGYKK